MKRTHRKVRTGCLTCRRRRVRCDELRPECLPCRKRRRFDPSIQCEYPADVEASPNSDAGPSGTQGSGVNLSNTGSPQSGPSPLAETAVDDQSLLHHIAEICIDLEKCGSHQWTCGTVILVEGYRRSSSFDFVRHALCGLAASHLTLLNKSISMVSWEYHHRVRAISGLLSCVRSVLQDETPQEEKVAAVDAILITSFLLSWYATESREYTQFLRGVVGTLLKVKHESLSSSIISTFAPVPSNLERSFPLTEAGNEVQVLSEAATALTNLHRVIKNDAELDRTVSELRNFVRNASRPQPIPSEDSQLAALFPIRNWLQWMPHAPYRLADQEPGTILVLAHHEMVKIAMQLLYPTIDIPLAINKTIECLEVLCQSILKDSDTTAFSPTFGVSSESSKTPLQTLTSREYNDLLEVPMRYVRSYRTKWGH